MLHAPAPLIFMVYFSDARILKMKNIYIIVCNIYNNTTSEVLYHKQTKTMHESS